MKIKILVLFLMIVSSNAYITGLFERNIVNLPNYKVTKANTMYIDIGHRFLTTLEEDGSVENMYQSLLGMDGTANIALTMSVGFGNLFDVTLTRYGFTKLYLLSTRVNILNQIVDKVPLSFTVDLNGGIRTQEGLDERNTYGGSAIFARNFIDEVILISTVFSYQFKTKGNWDLNPSGTSKDTFGIGGNIGFWLDRWTLAFEYNRPVYGYFREDFDGLITDNFGISLKYRTYQHNFGITISNHAFNSPTDLIAGGLNRDGSKTNLRFGFNITRELDFLSHDKETKVGNR